MAVNTSSLAKALWPGVNSWYGTAYDEYPVEVTDLFEKRTSRRAFEEIVGLSGLGLAVETSQGGAPHYDEFVQGFTTRAVHLKYTLGFIITKEMVDDDLYDVVGMQKAKGLAFSMRQTTEILGANVYNRAFNTSYTFGDGKAILVSDHPNRAGGTYSNILSTASDISEAALEQASIDISLLKNDRGLQIALRPVQLIIPPQLEFETHRILKATGRVGTADNDPNALKDLGKYTKVTMNHYLTDQDAWFIRTNAQDGMIHFEREPDNFDSDNDFDTKNAKFLGTMRRSFTVGDPRGLFGTPGA